MHIGGSLVKTSHRQPVELPFDGSIVGTVYQAGQEQVEQAVAAAKAAAPLMREMTDAGDDTG